MKWLDNIIRPHVEREVLRIKAREAVAKLPSPVVVTGVNVLATNPMLRGLDVLREAALKGMEPKPKNKTENAMPMLVMILGVVGQLVDGLISNGMKANWPKDLIDAIVAASSAIGAAHGLAVTKNQLEANRQVASTTPTA